MLKLTREEQGALIKEARFFGIMKSLSNAGKRASGAVKATRDARYTMLDESKGWVSFTHSMADMAAENGAVGAKTIGKGLTNLQYKISDADTYLGALAAGKNWRSATPTMRKSLFVNRKFNFTPEADKVFKKGPGAGSDFKAINTDKKGRVGYETPFPSITTPVKAAVPMLLASWAMPAGFKAMDDLRGVTRE